MIATIFFAFVPSVIRVWAFFMNIEPAIDMAWATSVLIAAIAYHKDKAPLELSPFLVVVVWFSILGILMHTVHDWSWWTSLIDEYRSLVS